MHLEALLALLGGAGVEAAREARRAAERLLGEMIRENPDNPDEYVFKRIPLRLPGPTLERDEGPLLSIPAWGLLTGGNPDLDEMTCRVQSAVDISIDGPEPPTAPGQSDIRVKLRRGPLGSGATKIDVTLKFKMGSPPELLESLRDRLALATREAMTAPTGTGSSAASGTTAQEDARDG